MRLIKEPPGGALATEPGPPHPIHPGSDVGSQIRLLVVSGDQDYPDRVSAAFAALRARAGPGPRVVVEVADELSQAEDRLYRGLFDVLLLDRHSVYPITGQPLGKLVKAAPTALILRRADSCSAAEPTRADHHVLQGGALGDWCGGVLNLACLPDLLCLALQRNEALAALWNSRQQLAALGDLSSAGVLIVDDEGREVYSNAVYREMAGVARGQGSWCSAVHPRERDRVRREWRNAANLQQRFNRRFSLQRPDGSVVPVQGSGAVIHADPAARDYAVMAFVFRKQDGDRLRTLRPAATPRRTPASTA